MFIFPLFTGDFPTALSPYPSVLVLNIRALLCKTLQSRSICDPWERMSTYPNPLEKVNSPFWNFNGAEMMDKTFIEWSVVFISCFVDQQTSKMTVEENNLSVTTSQSPSFSWVFLLRLILNLIWDNYAD